MMCEVLMGQIQIGCVLALPTLSGVGGNLPEVTATLPSKDVTTVVAYVCAGVACMHASATGCVATNNGIQT
jgi:hypothetical protein